MNRESSKKKLEVAMWCVLAYRQITFFPSEQEAKAAASKVQWAVVWNLEEIVGGAICQAMQQDKCPVEGWEKTCKEIKRICSIKSA